MIRRALFTSLAASILAACGKAEDPAPEEQAAETPPTAMGGKVDAKLAELGIVLPEATTPIAAYTPIRIVGNMVYIAGQGPSDQGVVGRDYTMEQGYGFARDAGINAFNFKVWSGALTISPNNIWLLMAARNCSAMCLAMLASLHAPPLAPMPCPLGLSVKSSPLLK